MWARPARVTEKPFKPLLNFQPLLLFGNPGSLAFLRQLGFQTYPELFDEAYDEETEPRARFEMAYRQLERLSRMDVAPVVILAIWVLAALWKVAKTAFR